VISGASPAFGRTRIQRMLRSRISWVGLGLSIGSTLLGLLCPSKVRSGDPRSPAGVRTGVPGRRVGRPGSRHSSGEPGQGGMDHEPGLFFERQPGEQVRHALVHGQAPVFIGSRAPFLFSL